MEMYRDSKNVWEPLGLEYAKLVFEFATNVESIVNTLEEKDENSEVLEKISDLILYAEGMFDLFSVLLKVVVTEQVECPNLQNSSGEVEREKIDHFLSQT